MSQFFEGTINKLVVFAAPRASGKTVFLTNPAGFISSKSLPIELADLLTQAPNYSQLVKLHNRQEKFFDVLYMHVDIFRPILMLRDYPSSRKELLDCINTELFTSWEAWEKYSKMAQEVHIVTMFVRREEHFRRWLYSRVLLENRSKWVLKLTTALLGDSTNCSEVHRRYHQMWQEVVGHLNPASNHVLEGSGTQYKFLPSDEFNILLEEGY